MESYLSECFLFPDIFLSQQSPFRSFSETSLAATDQASPTNRATEEFFRPLWTFQFTGQCVEICAKSLVGLSLRYQN
jgi:hypothetical protein